MTTPAREAAAAMARRARLDGAATELLKLAAEIFVAGDLRRAQLVGRAHDLLDVLSDYAGAWSAKDKSE